MDNKITSKIIQSINPNTHRLLLGNVGLTDSDLSIIANFKYLKVLYIPHNNIQTLSALTPLSELVYLDVSDNDLMTSSLANMNYLAQLWMLNISNNDIGNSGLKYLSKNKHLMLLCAENIDLSDDAMPIIAKLALKDLNIHVGNNNLTDHGLKALYHAPYLSYINLAYTNVSKAGIEALQQNVNFYVDTHQSWCNTNEQWSLKTKANTGATNYSLIGHILKDSKKTINN